MGARASEVRKARAFLRGRSLSLSAVALVKAAAELNKSFSETIAFLMRLRQGAQNQQAQRREVLLAAAQSGE
jgi:hypothetical protein